MKRGSWIAATGLTGFVVLAGSSFLAVMAADLRGSGREATEPRTVAEFTQVEVAGSVDIVVQVGGAPSVVVVGDDNLLANVRTDVEKGVLVVSAKESYSSRLGLRVKITTPRLDSVAVVGSGDAVLEGIKSPAFKVAVNGSGDVAARGTADDVEIAVHGSGDVTFAELAAKKIAVTVQGSGDVRLRGTADDLAVEIHGSGDVNCADLKTKQAKANLYGSGDAQVFVSDGLEANLFGSGDVTYGGDPPRVKSSIHGSGEVLKR